MNQREKSNENMADKIIEEEKEIMKENAKDSTGSQLQGQLAESESVRQADQ